MCGIVGFTAPTDGELLGRMLQRIVHRGPDDEGCFIEDRIAIGHRRLAIIDRAGGKQPMSTADGRYVIAFNGEIYNFIELRQRLESKGEVFRTHSDTEVLLSWIVRRGIEGLPALNGMFALALWDREKGRLLLARDRLGMKPMYLHEGPGGRLSFASEIKALLPVIGPALPNHQAIFQFITFQNILNDQTFFADVKKLLPGEWLTWQAGDIRRGRFWDISFADPFGGGFDTAVEEFKCRFQQAVRRHLIADVPVGAALSGGIDSSSVVAEAAARSNVMHTFTGAFNDSPYYDEREGARAVASHVGAQVHEIEITDQDYADHIGDVIYHLDEPSVGTGALPQYMVSKLASQHITVMLTGHGGDEAYAGYQVNKAVLIRETLTHRAWKLPRVLTDVQRDEWTRVLYYLLYPLFRSEVRHGLFIATPRSKRQMLLSGDFLDKCGDYEPLDEIQNVLGGSSLSPEQRLVILYLRTYLPTLLMQEDRMGMAHSIESRMPFCDNEIIDLGVSLPLLVKLGGGQLKAVIKEAMRPTLPPVLFGMPKRGFPTPFARWYRRSPLREMMEELLLGQRARQRGLFNPAAVQAIFKKNVASRTDNLYDYANANILHSLSMVELWFRTFIDSDGRGS